MVLMYLMLTIPDVLQLCTLMSTGGWTVERDEDLTAPYAFHDTTWVAFDDPTSVSIKVSSTQHLLSLTVFTLSPFFINFLQTLQHSSPNDKQIRKNFTVDLLDKFLEDEYF